MPNFHLINEKKEGRFCLLYGASGIGKTKQAEFLAKHGYKVLMLNVEAGTASINKDSGVCIEDCTSSNDVRRALTEIRTDPDYKQFDVIFVDSISEVGEILLSEEMSKTRDGRAAYGQMRTTLFNMVRAFKYLKSEGVNVVFCAKEALREADDGRVIRLPSLPGKENGKELCYEFDLVLPLIATKVQTEKGVEINRYFVTQNEGAYEGKLRTSRSDIPLYVPADLGAFLRFLEGENS